MMRAEKAALDTARVEFKKIKAFIKGIPSIDKTKEALDKLTPEWEQEGDKLQKLTSLQAEWWFSKSLFASMRVKSANWRKRKFFVCVGPYDLYNG